MCVALERPHPEELAAPGHRLHRLQGVNPLAVDLRYSNGFAVRWPEVAPEGEGRPVAPPATESERRVADHRAGNGRANREEGG